MRGVFAKQSLKENFFKVFIFELQGAAGWESLLNFPIGELEKGG